MGTNLNTSVSIVQQGTNTGSNASNIKLSVTNTNMEKNAGNIPSGTAQNTFSGTNVAQHTQDFFQNDDIETNEQNIADLVDKLNAAYNPLNLSVSFAYDEGMGSLYVEVKRVDTGELLRQIPSEEALKLMNTMREFRGMFLDADV